MNRSSKSNRIFDDEGFPVQENVFIDKGVLKTYLHNTSTAKIFKTETTGNAGLVQPYPWNIEMDPGGMGKNELFDQVKHGLYLTNTWYTRFQNYATGDFSTIPRDGIFLIENGEIKEPLREVSLSGNILNLLSKVENGTKEIRLRAGYFGGCGKSGQFPLPCGLGGPELIISEVTFGGKAG